ncbi:MAG: lipopolysaccharide biosynthesis protein [Dysgonamonadaceae bacterium]|jgi:O-antigen/teichoic acid export membrane protein|nr:lipopolysaccharide biosynthesis protein [Dysgonamonadaceae bacterium]
MADSSLKQTTAKGLFWGAFGNAAQQIVGAVFGMFLARILTKEDWGMYGLLLLFFGIANSIVNSGFSRALINIRETRKRDYNAVFWFSVLVGLALYLILFFCSPLIADYQKVPELTAFARVSFLSILFGAVGIAPFAYMSKHLMVKQLAAINFISLVVGWTAGIVLAVNGAAYWAIGVQNLLYISLAAIARFFFSPWKPSFKIDFSPLKKMYSFSVKLFITDIFNQVSGNFFAQILNKTCGLAHTGNFTQGQKWAAQGQSFVQESINYVAQPVMAQVNEEKERQVAVLRKMLRFGAFVSFPLLLGLAFVGREFILITIGEKWLGAVPILQLTCLWSAFVFAQTLLSSLIYTRGKSGIYMYIYVASGLAMIAALLLIALLTPAYDSDARMLAMLKGYLAVNFASLFVWYYFVRRLIGLKFFALLKDILPYLTITAASFALAWLLTRSIENVYLLLTLKIALSAIFYLTALKLSNSVMFRESMDFFTSRFKAKQDN